jgi:aminopeptidase N
MKITMKLIMVFLVFLPLTALGADLHYALDVQINTEEKKITGTALIKADANKKIGLSVRNLRNLKVEGTPVTTAPDKRISVTCQSGKETMISFDALFVDKETNFIDKDNVFLTEEWYPQPDLLVEYALSVTLPKNFIATSAADEITVAEHAETKIFHFQFKHPLDTLHVAASTRYVLKKDSHNDIAIETYFFEEDARLADTYIDYTKKYLKMYETMLTRYPYRRFAVVENIFPFGDSMPTYILLGSRVVHLPYTVKTSLGHGILHEWFGKSVYVDFAHGNWAEGITTYLADYHHATLRGKDRDYRKQIMVDYDAYVNWENAIPISNFRERHNKAQSAIGYGKTAMVFHSLRKRYGDKTFFAALREFIRLNTFRMASWHDIQRGFENVTGEKLYRFFRHWLTRRDIPDLHAEDGELRVSNGRLELNLTLMQQIEAYPLHIPITLYTESSKSQRVIEMKDPKESISLILDEPPTKVVIDENYDLMRHLAPEEIPFT